MFTSFVNTFFSFFTEPSYVDMVDTTNNFEDTNKILLEKYTRETAVRTHRSPHFYDSNHSLERPIFATPISDRTITENSASVKFTCSVLSSDCEISWEKNGIPIRPSSKHHQTFTDGLAILEIHDVSDTDAGKYNCVASNKFGESVTSAKLKVYSGFKPSVSMPPIVTRQMKGMVHWDRFYISPGLFYSLYCCIQPILFSHDYKLIHLSNSVRFCSFPLLFFTRGLPTIRQIIASDRKKLQQSF